MAKNERIVNVQPLRTKEEIDEMKLDIKRGNKGTPKRPELAKRDVLIFLIGMNTGLRVNDIIRLKVGDVKGKTNLSFMRVRRLNGVRLMWGCCRTKLNAIQKIDTRKATCLKAKRGMAISQQHKFIASWMMQPTF